MSGQENRQPPLPEHQSGLCSDNLGSEEPPPSSISQSQDKSEAEDQICRKYIWGTCDKHQSQCRFRHVRDIELMKKILKFCHDFQNQGCTRPNCSYLHTTREDQNLFKNFGQIPQVLLERYAIMDARANNIISENMSPIAGNISYVSPQPIQTVVPPPPPPPPPGTKESMIRPVPTASITNPLAFAPPPPPPPPPQPSTPQIRARIQTSPSPQYQMTQKQTTQVIGGTKSSNPQFSINTARPPPTLPQRPTFLQSFDASKPPPPIPQPQTREMVNFGASTSRLDTNSSSSTIRNNYPNQFKRHCVALDSLKCRMEADSTQGDNELCADCIQREISIGEHNKQIENMLCLEADRELIYQQKLEEFNRAKNLFLSVIGSDHRNVIEDYIDAIPSNISCAIGNNLQSLTLNQGLFGSSMPNNIMFQLFELFANSNLGNQVQNIFDPPAHIRQHIAPVTRRVPAVQQLRIQDLENLLHQLIEQCGNLIQARDPVPTRTSPVIGTGSSGLNVPAVRLNHNLFEHAQGSAVNNKPSNINHIPTVSANNINPVYHRSMPPPTVPYYSQSYQQPSASTSGYSNLQQPRPQMNAAHTNTQRPMLQPIQPAQPSHQPHQPHQPGTPHVPQPTYDDHQQGRYPGSPYYYNANQYP